MVEQAEWFSPDPNETVVWTGKPRVWRILTTVASAAFWALVGIAIAWAVVTHGADAADGGLPVPDVVVWAVALLWVAVMVGQVVVAYLRVEATDYVLTDRNVYKKTGILSETVTTVGIDRIQNTTLRKDVTGNLFDYGTVKLSTAGSGGAALDITDLDNPEAFQDELGPLVAAAGGPGEDLTGRNARPTGILDAETVDALVPEARRMREAAERLESHFDV